MRRPGGRLLNKDLVVTYFAWSQDRAQGRVATATGTATYRGALHQLSVDDAPAQNRASAPVDCLALFAADPGLKAGDLVSDGTTTMAARAAALDQAGRGGCWVVHGTRKD